MACRLSAFRIQGDFHGRQRPSIQDYPAVYSASTTPSPIDLSGYESAAVLIEVGVGGITFNSTNYINFVLQESDDGVTFTNVTAAELTGSEAPASVTNGVLLSLQAAHASPSVQLIGYKGGKRYLQLAANFAGTHATGTPISASVIKGNPIYIPAA